MTAEAGGPALDGPHWRFALHVYGRPGVAGACLELQDRWGVDVNLLLMTAYAAARLGRVLDLEDIRRLNDAVAEWREQVVLPLRGVRRRLKQSPLSSPPDSKPLRSRVKALEIEAEQIEQAVLAAALPRPGAASLTEGEIVAALSAVVAYYGGVANDEVVRIVRAALSAPKD